MKKSTGKSERKERRPVPGRSIESSENQIIALAYRLAAERILKKTATAQEILHFVKSGSVQAQLEKDKLEKENQLLEAKTEAIKSQKRVEELYAAAMLAYRTYNGEEDLSDED